VAPALKRSLAKSRELALMLAASRGDPTREAVKALMAGPLDWERLARLAADSHATPGVWAVVSAFPNLPPEASTLQRLAVVNDFRRYHIRNLVARVVRVLREHDIEIIVLKGAALLVGGVARPVARTMSDIDVLVVKGSPEDAWNACRADGWSLVDPAWDEELYRSHHHLPPLVDPDGVEIGLEVHRTLLPGVELVGVDTAGFLSRARPVMIGDVAVVVPSPEDLLLHDCLHFAWSNKLHRGAWRAFADAHTIIGDPAFRWDGFLALVTSIRAKMCCYWALRLARTLADLPVPDEVLRALDPSSGGAFAALLERHFVRQVLDADAEGALSEMARRWFWYRAMRGRGSSGSTLEPWSVGDVQFPDAGLPARVPRGPVRAAMSSFTYLVRLVTGG